MSFKIWLIILFLAACDVFLGIQAVRVWSDGEKTLPETEKRKPVASVEQGIGQRNIPPEAEYEVVVESNLFQPTRSEPVAEKVQNETGEKKGVPDQRLVKLLQETVRRISVYGIMMVNEEKRALIKSPTMPLLIKPGSRQQAHRSGEEIQWVKVGDAVDRFTVNEIKATGVVLGAEGLLFDVALYDKDNPKARVPEKTAAGPIVIDTGKGAQAESPPEKSEAPKEKSPEKKLPIEPGKKTPDSPLVQVEEPEKR